MSDLTGFSERLELANIPEGPGMAVLEDAQGRVLQVAMSKNIRRRVGELLDSEGYICAYGPKIYDAQQAGRRVFVRWKLTPDYKQENRRLVAALRLWKPPYVQLLRPFAPGERLEDMVAEGLLYPHTLSVFCRDPDDPTSTPIQPYFHQSRAGANVIVATGAGLGKSFAFGEGQ